MNPRNAPRLDAALYIDIPSIVALAARCTAAAPDLPGLADVDVRRFMRMAASVDPRPMLLDEEFDVRFRFELFAAMVTPLADLTRCYALAYDLKQGRDDAFSIYLDTLTFTVHALCAGLELFASIRSSATRAPEPVRRTITEAQRVFGKELSLLLLRLTHVLDRPDLLTADEAVTLTCAMGYAAQQLARPGNGPASPASRHVDAERGC